MLPAMAAPVVFAPLGSAARDEISIVGAGPAGLACAIVLARAGRRVVIHEHRNRVGARFHGDFQGLDNWTGDCDVIEELQSHGIQPNFEYHPVRGGIAFDAWGRSYPYTSSHPIYYLVKRGSDPDTLDCGLLRQALDAGVDVRFGHHHSADNVRVISCGPRAADVVAVGYLFATDMPDGAWICFNRQLAPLGYSYLLIHRGRGTVASCMFEDFKREHLFLERTVAFFAKAWGCGWRRHANLAATEIMTYRARVCSMARFYLANAQDSRIRLPALESAMRFARASSRREVCWKEPATTLCGDTSSCNSFARGWQTAGSLTLREIMVGDGFWHIDWRRKMSAKQ